MWGIKNPFGCLALARAVGRTLATACRRQAACDTVAFEAVGSLASVAIHGDAEPQPRSFRLMEFTPKWISACDRHPPSESSTTTWGWSYRVSPIRNRRRAIKDWTTCSPLDNCKLEAIKVALAELGRQDDPHSLLDEWLPLGKGSEESRNEEEYRLLKGYQAAARHLLWSVDRLLGKQGDPRAFSKALKAADEAQRSCETARAALAKFQNREK